MLRLLNLFTNLFPVWVLLGGVLALFQPMWFTWFKGPAIIWGLAVIMLGMGLTLTVDDFKGVLKIPRCVVIGVLAQFCFMPLLGWSIAHLFKLETAFAVGLILVACCPGGTASNVVVYLARANVALSVMMTMCSTFAAVALTPLLTKWLAGSLVAVNGWALFLDTVKIVVAPVLIGLMLSHRFPGTVKRILPLAPLVSVITIALICASIVGQNAERIREHAGVLLLAIFCLHSLGFLLGYSFARFFGYDRMIRRTISIEVGMQNSGLGVALARNFADPLTAVPSAISSVFHSVIGSILAGIWRIGSTSRISPTTEARIVEAPVGKN
ncbi:MAG: bile acid:sodium symporter family protein [Verrucomicrobia bacterium]|nr:bile acid:sodium symporter family protein [Verrucomicrobiota bacterium]